MGSYRLNLATCKGLPPAKQLADRMETLKPKTDDDYEFAVLAVRAGEGIVLADVLVRSWRKVSEWNVEKAMMEAKDVRVEKVLPCMLWPDKELLATVTGGVSTLETIMVLLATELALPVVVEPVQIDLLYAIEELRTRQNRFQLKAVKHSAFASDSYTEGPFAPRFLDTVHGIDFCRENESAIDAVTVTWAGPSKRVRLVMRKQVGFSYSCHEDDAEVVKTVLMNLAFPSDRRILEAVRDLCPKDGQSSVSLTTTGKDGKTETVTLTNESRKRANRKLGASEDA